MKFTFPKIIPLQIPIFLLICIFTDKSSSDELSDFSQSFKDALRLGENLLEELTDLEGFEKSKELKRREFEEDYEKNVVPWAKGMQDIVEIFHAEYNPLTSDKTLEEFQVGFKEMQSKLEVEYAKTKDLTLKFHESLSGVNDASKSLLDKLDVMGEVSVKRFQEADELLHQKAAAIYTSRADKGESYDDILAKHNEDHEKLKDIREQVKNRYRDLGQNSVKGQERQMYLEKMIFGVRSRFQATGLMLESLKLVYDQATALVPTNKQRVQIIMIIDSQRSQVNATIVESVEKGGVDMRDEL